jgi:hypothetical protein
MNPLDIIPLPYRLLALAGFAVALAGGGYVAGLHHEQILWQAADVLRAKQDQAQLLAATQQARANEQALRAKLDTANELRLKEQSDHETTLAAVRAAARAGTERLHCPAAALPARTAPANPDAAARPGPEAGPGDLVPASADDLFGIAGRIVEIVRQRNALIDAYNAARSTCNAP